MTDMEWFDHRIAQLREYVEEDPSESINEESVSLARRFLVSKPQIGLSPEGLIQMEWYWNYGSKTGTLAMAFDGDGRIVVNTAGVCKWGKPDVEKALLSRVTYEDK